MLAGKPLYIVEYLFRHLKLALLTEFEFVCLHIFEANKYYSKIVYFLYRCLKYCWEYENMHQLRKSVDASVKSLLGKLIDELLSSIMIKLSSLSIDYLNLVLVYIKYHISSYFFNSNTSPAAEWPPSSSWPRTAKRCLIKLATGDTLFTSLGQLGKWTPAHRLNAMENFWAKLLWTS